MTTTSHPANTNIFVESRSLLIDWVRQQLIGPPPVLSAEEQVLRGVLPSERFPCGAIYPITSGGEGIDPASDTFDEVIDEDETEGRPVVSRRYVPPSSLGFSFYIRGEDIRFQIICSAAGYKKRQKANGKENLTEWERYSLARGSEGEEFINVICPNKEVPQTFRQLTDHARVDVLWRRFAEGWIVTVTLSNAQTIDDRAEHYFVERSEKTLFETKLRCVIDSGEVGVYPGVDRSLLDEEEQEIELQYSERHTFAIGHGCAANWMLHSNRVSEIRTEIMPTVEVPQVTSDTGSSEDRALWLSELSGLEQNYQNPLPVIAEFIEGYSKWVNEQEESLVSDSAFTIEIPADELQIGRTHGARWRTDACGIEALGD